MTLGSQSSVNGYSGGDYLSEDSVLRSHPLYPTRKQRCCNINSDGFTIITVCFFIFTSVLTVAFIVQIHYGSPEVTPHGAVATNKDICSHVGITVMSEGGSAVDVAIASSVCMAVVHPHAIGPGGSGVMLVHDHKMNSTVIVDFMSAIPKAHQLQEEQPSPRDGRSIGVPGFFRGLEYAHRKFGKLPWHDLFQPSIAIASQGFQVSDHLVDALNQLNIIQVEGITPFEKTFFPNGVKLEFGDFMKREKFAELLDIVARYGADSFYALNFGVEEFDALKAVGSEIHVKDFENYQVHERPCIHSMVKNMSVYTAPAPFGGPQLLMALDLLSNANLSQQQSQSFLYHSFNQAIRKSYAGFVQLANTEETTLQNLTESILASMKKDIIDGSVTLANTDLLQVPQQTGTSISVIDTFDQYVTLVAGLGTYFGSQVMTESGILFNNHLANVPPHPDGHYTDRPLTTYTPIIITDAQQVCGPRTVLSSPEVGSVLQVAGQLLFQHQALNDAIEQPRITVKPGDNQIYVEDYGTAANLARLPGTVRNDLQAMNYTFRPLSLPYTSVNGVSKTRDKLISLSDVRGGGIARRLEPVVLQSDNSTDLK